MLPVVLERIEVYKFLKSYWRLLLRLLKVGLAANKSLQFLVVYSVTQFCVLNGLNNVFSLLNLNFSLDLLLLVPLFVLLLRAFLLKPGLIVLLPQIPFHFALIFIQNKLLNLLRVYEFFLVLVLSSGLFLSFGTRFTLLLENVFCIVTD